MKMNYSKISWFFIRIWLLIQFFSENGLATKDGSGATGLISRGDDISSLVGTKEQLANMLESDRLTRMEKEIERLNEKLESSDENHRKEIENIHNIISKVGEFITKNEFNEIKGRVARIETYFFHHEDNNHRSRRGISLSTLPPCMSKLNCAFDFKEKVHGEQIFKPPTSCMDLKQVGHFLTGYYPIKRGRKISLIFCNFNSNNSKASETMIGNVDIKTESVHFYVQRNTTFNQEKAVITFELDRLNEGDAMSLESGIFTAPVPGLYHFEFSAQKDDSRPYAMVVFQVNGETIGAAETAHYNSAMSTFLSMSLTATVRLKKNDTANLLNWNSALYDDKNHHTHFIGRLIEEDLFI